MAIKHKNISFQAYNLLFHLQNNSTSCLKLNTAYSILSENNKLAVRKLLSDMTDRGLLMRIKAGHYHPIPFERDPDTYMPEWHSIASCLVDGADHYIGYYSALQLHGLITQPSLKEQIVVAEQQKPSELKIRNVNFQFIYHNEVHFFGWTNKWVDSFSKVRCSDLEKTFIDCLFQPEYGGGIVEIAKALYASKEKIKFPQLVEYVDKFGSQAVLKRLGFLMELMEIERPITEALSKKKSSSYILLDPSLPKAGRYISRWNIIQNMDSETITSSLFT